MPVSDVNADHQSTMRASTRRGPIRSPSAPVGISKMQHDNVNIAVTQAHPTGSMPRSSCIRGPATEMQTRSMW
jgi:hypothetical protein